MRILQLFIEDHELRKLINLPNVIKQIHVELKYDNIKNYAIRI